MLPGGKIRKISSVKAKIEIKPKIIAVTGANRRFMKYAVIAADRFKKLNNIDTKIINIDNYKQYKLVHPAWIKAYVWDIYPDADVIIWIDADILPINKLDLNYDMTFGGVLDRMESINIAKSSMSLLNDDYINTGFFICNKSTKGLFDKLKNCMLNEPIIYYEQSWLNYVIQSNNIKLSILPQEYNWLINDMGEPPVDVKLIHFAGSKENYKVYAAKS